VREHLIALYLCGGNRIVSYAVVSTGTATATLVHPREVFQPAVLLGSCGVIVGHNHPSGELKPSPEDVQVTRGSGKQVSCFRSRCSTMSS
jgi:DNA repair protein RadC